MATRADKNNCFSNLLFLDFLIQATIIVFLFSSMLYQKTMVNQSLYKVCGFVRSTSTNPLLSNSDGNPLSPVEGAIVFLDSPMKDNNNYPPQIEQQVSILAMNGRLQPEYWCLLPGQKCVIKFVEQGEYAIRVLQPGDQPLGRLNNPDPRSLNLVFDKQILCIYLTCDIHPELRGYVTVAPNRNYTFSRHDGSFVLPYELEPGNYTLTSFHPERGKSTFLLSIGIHGAIQPVNILLPVLKK